MLSSELMDKTRKGALAVLVALAALAGCRARPKPAAAADPAPLTDATASAPTEAGAPVDGEAALSHTAWLKDATDAAQDPLAKVAAQRLAETPAPVDALSGPDKLAAVCVQARVACGFELKNGVWNRPEARLTFSGATAAQALATFAGKDYRLAWLGPVAHFFPVESAGTPPLDAALAADVSMNSLSREPAETIHDIAVKLGLEMPAPRARPLRTDLVGASTMPVRNSARYILDYLTRPAILHPSSYVAVYGPGRGGSLRWFWGEPPPW